MKFLQNLLELQGAIKPDNYLYHFSPIDSAYEIIRSNTLAMSQKHGNLSFTRTLDLDFWKLGCPIIVFKVNRRKLQHNYELVPFRWHGYRKRSRMEVDEYEEVTNKDIRNFDKYIEEIISAPRKNPASLFWFARRFREHPFLDNLFKYNKSEDLLANFSYFQYNNKNLSKRILDKEHAPPTLYYERENRPFLLSIIHNIRAYCAFFAAHPKIENTAKLYLLDCVEISNKIFKEYELYQEEVMEWYEDGNISEDRRPIIKLAILKNKLRESQIKKFEKERQERLKKTLY